MNATVDTFRVPQNALEIAGRHLDSAFVMDNMFPSFLDLTGVAPNMCPTASGLVDQEYPPITGSQSLPGVTLMKTVNKVPLPPEVMEHFGHMQCHCTMGLFTEISRAWLTIDSDIYVWTYEHGSDVAYFDGLNETIVSVGLVKPRLGVFHSFIRYLLVLTTAVDITVLGVTFSSNSDGPLGELEEMHLVPDPVFVLPTDGIPITTIKGTDDGRLFLGGRDGSLFEISYQAESSWFGKRCKKINHSTTSLSFLVPSFLNVAFSEEDPISQISIDNSRHILYTLSEKGTIEVYDLGVNGDTLHRTARISQASLVQQAMNIVRTLDSITFRPIVSISALESGDCVHINLVAVAATGVRLYLTTVNLSNFNAAQRPYTIQLVHVRLPPGFSANSSAIRPKTVHLADYRESTLMMVTSPGPEHDTLWCLSSDTYPFTPGLIESYTVMDLDGPAWALAEIREAKRTPGHVLIRQHAEPPRKYVVLTAAGAHLLLKLRPADMLRQLLTECRGADGEPVREFFHLQREEHACASCLVIACATGVQDTEMGEWAARAFFLYGSGETKRDPPTPTPEFNPPLVSTPATHHFQMQPQLHSPHHEMKPLNRAYSPKHDGFYLYGSRLLRPFWQQPCCVRRHPDLLASSVSADDCGVVLSNLHDLRAFLQKHAHISTLDMTMQDARLEERQSIDALRYFLGHACEVIGLWRVLCEHQFHLLVAAIPKEQQAAFQQTTFKDLILYGRDLCSALVTSLVNSYLGDNASVDSISGRLREVCPNLYRSEDAACSKANEMLLGAKSQPNTDEREEMLRSALRLCKDVAPNLNLSAACQKFIANQCYSAVVELCATCAEKLDPDNVAGHYYNERQPAEDHDGYRSFARRMDVYKELTDMLEGLHGQEDHLNSTIAQALRTSDKLMHVAVYDWMLNKGMLSELLEITEPSLETYLQRAPPRARDLLWKYYEKNGNHPGAAQILNTLAQEQGSHITLQHRLDYLSRAVMCMRSDRMGYAPHLGVFLRELEDRIDVARVQMQILTALRNKNSTDARITNAIRQLNSRLFDITQLYEEFAAPFHLWDCKLAIVHCSGHNDRALVRTIWSNIIATELSKSEGTASERMTHLLDKIENLALRYKDSENCFPLEYVLNKLEEISCRIRADYSLIPQAFVSIGFPFDQLIAIYHRMFAANQSAWTSEANEFLPYKSIAEIISCFVERATTVSNSERRKTIAHCQDVIAGVLSTLYSKPNTERLVQILRNLQFKLDKL